MLNQKYETNSLTEEVDLLRIDASRLLREDKSSLGQYMTPAPIARFMSSLFGSVPATIRLLDPGAGIGSLTSAFVERVLSEKKESLKVQVDAFEIDSLLVEYLSDVLNHCEKRLVNKNNLFSYDIIEKDFIEDGVEQIISGSQSGSNGNLQYTHCITNPPYKKIKSNSSHRQSLRKINIEATNLYSAFLCIAIKRLNKGGEIVAIIPRSFCNGVYFKPFRRLLLEELSISQIHIFEKRNKAFKEDNVLQENIIIHGIKGVSQGHVKITSSIDSTFEQMTLRNVDFAKVVSSKDPDQFIHIATSEFDQRIIDHVSIFSHQLSDLDVNVSTGPVVDFRLRDDIKDVLKENTYPLIYPCHIKNNYVCWTGRKGKKPCAIVASNDSERWLMPNGWYVVIRRFTSKEESRRLVAAIHDPSIVLGDKIGFENHLNILHSQKKGLDPLIAKGLSVYINSSLLDLYFRQFSGHTQVNATDLKMMKYPSRDVLRRMGRKVQEVFPSQSEIDAILESEISKIVKNSGNPVTAKKKIYDATKILKSLGLPRGQLNDRSALTLLALLDLKPLDSWSDVTAPLMGVTPIMDYIKEHYQVKYKPNTRESIRKLTLHQFTEAAIVDMNPDQPDRPINSPKWC